MKSYLYLSLDLAAILIPLATSFYPPHPFFKKWKGLFAGILITGSVFIVWDIYFTKIGIWGFNPEYLTGIYFFNLPLEEILFFICIPYACVFTYFAFKVLIKSRPLINIENFISYTLIFLLAIAGILFIDKAYTATTFFLTALLIGILKHLKVTWLDRFYLTYAVILIPFFLINGVLTGSFIEGEIVWYNNSENIGLRMGTIPVEDTFYGMALLLGCTYFYENINEN